ncbi:MAG: carbon storage regulator CsrA [Clostridia bacterium]|nr:carbon storage regulator CsrA [Clostridia bacterium]
MLVLTRKIGNNILIGDDIKISLISIDGDKARIGIEAPRNIRILREESITDTIEANQRAVNEVRDLKELFSNYENKEK